MQMTASGANLWLTGDVALTAPYSFEDQTKNVIIAGKLSSDHTISFKVKNLVIFGSLILSSESLLQASEDIFNGGDLDLGENGSRLEGVTLYNGLCDDVAIEKIRALGIVINRADPGYTVALPPEVSVINHG